MKLKPFPSLAPLCALLAATALLAGCGSKDSGTNPMPVAEPFESGDLPNGSTYVRTFPNEGTFSYRCRLHPGMTGTVTVAAGGEDSARVEITNNLFSAPVAGGLPIHPNGYVRWVNISSPHSVTRP